MRRLVPLVALLACDGGKGDDARSTVLDADADADADADSDADTDVGTADGGITFPPPVSLTELATLTFSGVGDPETLAGASVEGVAATSADGWATWSAAVPTTLGTSLYALDGTTPLGLPAPGVDAVEVTRVGPLLTEIDTLAADGPGGLAWRIDGRSVVEIELATGVTREISGLATGSGPPFPWVPSAFAWDAAGGRLLVLDGSSLFGVEPGTGARTLLAEEATTPGPWPQAATGAAVDTDQDRLLVLSPGQPELVIGFDLTTFAATALSRLSDPGPTPNPAQDAAFVPGDDALLVTSQFDGQVIRVDLSTGARTVVAGASVGSGDPLYLPTAICTDGATAWVGTTQDVLALDLASGVRTRLADATVPSFLPSAQQGDMVWDGTRILVADQSRDAVAAYDPVTGARTVVGSYAIGGGAELFYPTDVDWDRDGGRLIAIDVGALLAVDPQTGARTELSGPSVGSGEPSLGRSLTVVDGVAWVQDVFALHRYDLATGARETISASWRGAGPNLGLLGGVAVSDAAGTELYVGSAAGWVMSVDPVTGDRAFVADDTSGLGAGPSLVGLSDLVWDGARVLALKSDVLLAVDPATGDRVEVSGPSVGAGPPLLQAQRIRLVDGRLFVGSFWDELLLVDPVSGDRTQLAPPSSPGPLGVQGWAAAPDGTLWATSPIVGAVLAVSPVSGERVIFSR